MERHIVWTGRVKPGRLEEYLELHRNPPAALIAAMRRANIHDYRIHRQGDVLFTTFRWTGTDWDADLAAYAAEPICQELGPVAADCLEPMDATGNPWVTPDLVFDEEAS